MQGGEGNIKLFFFAIYFQKGNYMREQFIDCEKEKLGDSKDELLLLYLAIIEKER